MKKFVQNFLKKYRFFGVFISVVLILLMVSVIFFDYRPTIIFPQWQEYQVIGIDVSRYQKKIKWNYIAQAKIDFCFIKVTEGNYLVDKYFNLNWQDAKANKIHRGAYHFYKYDVSWKTQFNLLKSTLILESGDLPVAIDIEEHPEENHQQFVEDLKQFLNAVENHYKSKPILYTGRKFYDSYLSEEFSDYLIWVANYTHKKPKLLHDKAWTFWQYSESGRLTGINAKVDMNVFNGNKAELKKILVK
ncbi:MAG: glycoside hydrolase family 25 protein [Chitinophagales bacterium]|jgi:lysozyme|nr:glycoside hydrolase family 25 protein [Chitinophagales bacterium]